MRTGTLHRPSGDWKAVLIYCKRARPARETAPTNLPRARGRGCKPPDSKPGCLHGDILVTFALPTFAPAALQLG